MQTLSTDRIGKEGSILPHNKGDTITEEEYKFSSAPQETSPNSFNMLPNYVGGLRNLYANRFDWRETDIFLKWFFAWFHFA